MIYGLLWRFDRQSSDELNRAWEFVRMRHGPENFTGKIFGHSSSLKGVTEDRTIPRGCWLFEFKASDIDRKELAP